MLFHKKRNAITIWCVVSKSLRTTFTKMNDERMTPLMKSFYSLPVEEKVSIGNETHEEQETKKLPLCIQEDEEYEKSLDESLKEHKEYYERMKGRVVIRDTEEEKTFWKNVSKKYESYTYNDYESNEAFEERTKKEDEIQQKIEEENLRKELEELTQKWKEEDDAKEAEDVDADTDDTDTDDTDTDDELSSWCDVIFMNRVALMNRVARDLGLL